MLAITLDTAQNLSIVIVTALVILAVASIWLMKQMVQKLIVAGVLVLIAFLVWSNRATLQDCADNITADFEDGSEGDPECTFFGFTVTVPVP